MLSILKKQGYIPVIILLLISFLTLQGCNDKKDDKKKSDEKSKGNSELVKTDDKGQKVDLKMKPKVGDKMRYKMMASTNSVENSPATQNKDINSEQSMIYYFSQEVAEVNESGVITYKMKYDSILVSTKIATKDSSLSEVYNSNIKDSVYAKPDFLQYNAMIGQEFKLRVNAQGEVYDVYELEKIHENIFKALGDTLRPEDKASIKESMGSDAMKSIIQNQFQKFPATEVYKDSSWTFTNEAQLLVFPIKNQLGYKLSEIQNTNNETVIKIVATLGVDFVSKEHKDKGITIKIEDSKASGEGSVSFNLSRGCIVKKETTTNISLAMKLSAKGQSAKSEQKLTTKMSVELL